MEIDRNHAENLGRPLFLYFYFGERVIFLGKLASPCAKTCFFLEVAQKNFLGIFFFFFFWRTLAPCVFGLGLERVRLENSGLWPWSSNYFLCPWPWPRRLCPRLHLCQQLQATTTGLNLFASLPLGWQRFSRWSVGNRLQTLCKKNFAYKDTSTGARRHAIFRKNWRTSVWFGYVRKAFLPRLKGKTIAIIYNFLPKA